MFVRSLEEAVPFLAFACQIHQKILAKISIMLKLNESAKHAVDTVIKMQSAKKSLLLIASAILVPQAVFVWVWVESCEPQYKQ
jgi:hypothetical protein